MDFKNDENIDDEKLIEEISNLDDWQNNDIEENLEEIPNEEPVEETNETPSTPLEDVSENNTSNCLALTIKEDYKLTTKINKILKPIRMSFKVFVSYVTLNIIKLFF